MLNLQPPRSIKLEILKILASQEDKLFHKIDAITFFDFILDLRNLRSTDSRYSDAKGDLTQHYINNSDWDLEYIFLDRFDFLDSDDNFFKLLNLVVSPIVNNSEDEIKFFYHTLNPILNNYSIEYRLKNINDDGLSIFEIDKFDNYNKFKDIVDNSIQFVLDGNSNKGEIYLFLSPTNWDDYGSKNEFALFYYNCGQIFNVGKLKIISKSNTSTTKGIVNNFLMLDSNYCSLGQNFSFYENLKRIFNGNYLSILKALNDCAFFPQICEDFEDEQDFKNSLIRYDEAEQLLRQARYRIDNYDLSNLYSFEYFFKPNYISEGDALRVSFNFNDTSIVPSRIYTLIGKNGVGKTQLVSNLPIDIAKANTDLFLPKIPIFSKVIAVSYSVFDKFMIPENSSKINYVYCGLRQKKNQTESILSESELNDRFFLSIQKVQKSKRFDSWREISESFFSKDLVEKWIEWDAKVFQEKLNLVEFRRSLKTFSSGQAIFIYILTEILANIRYDSLIIFDEPETHLHPNAISQLINSIHLLVKKFQSFCIIATHSPIIVQGILSKNVYVIRNENNILSAKHPAIETFGENLTKITEDIFGARATPSQFKKELQLLINKGYSFDQIIELLQSQDVPLSLNLTVLLKSMVTNQYD
ncbi:AAA family ATPase [Acinetobacter venetianus]|uniref:AbiJ-related protein n=1 Tax=Acinetobacter venetianus TaxID=52133 RepID=UPI000775C709|nr:AAA family ATPase [Acinetobacter venetianus]KXO84079.1 AAA family ATPase [Acinetobacter venetianus]